MATLDQAAVDQYWREGYLVARGCVDAAALDAFMQDLDHSLRQHLRQLGLPAASGGDLAAIHENLVTLHRHDQQRYVAMLRVFSRAKSLYDAFLSSGIAEVCRCLGVARPILHTLPIFHLISNRLRISGGYHGFDAHQDWTALQTSINTVAIWLPFHDVDGDGFPVEILPGSHTRGVLPGTSANNEYMIDPSCIDGSGFRPVEMKKGDVMFMTLFTVHRTGMRESDKLRVAASWRYEDAVDSAWIARGYPFAQSRTVQHELFTPAFPDARQMGELMSRKIR